MIIQHNITSMNANRQLGLVGNNLAKATEKLSSGYRVNRAADDAAGLAISEKMRAQVRGLNRASDNAQDGISMIQTAEGAMEQQDAILQRARELVVQASNSGVLNKGDADDDFQKINDELEKLGEEFTRINTDTEFNKKKLLDGSYSGQYLQIGANEAQGVTVDIEEVTWDDYQVSEDGFANSALLTAIDAKLEEVNTQRSKLGAIQNRLEYAVKVDDNSAENLQAAESRIRDTDMADEMTRFSKESILQQAKEEVDGGKIGYDTNAVVVTEEDELQKLADEMNKNDGEISLEYKNVATSQDGSNFNCYIANSAKNRYDMYVGIYTDVDYSEELYLSKLMKPGSGIKNFQCKKKPEPGVHDVVMVFTFVENDHATIHSQTNVTYTLHVEE